MSKYTKGPWKLGVPTPIGIVGGGQILVTLFANDETEYRGPSKLADILDDEKLPNARLIAAAPELLIACKLALSSCEPHDASTKYIESIIAKAEGK